MDANDRLTRLENALIDLVIVVTEGNLARLGAHWPRTWRGGHTAPSVPPGSEQ